MSDGVLVSFCIPVYNQKELVRKCIGSIVMCDDPRIEIVINDDGSTEDLRALAESFQDARIKYYRNPENLGHDRNILQSFLHASGQYAFLLRSRDQMIPESIPTLLDVIEKHPDCGYFLGAAIDEDGKARLNYEDTIIHETRDRIDAAFTLLIHPSGSCYKLSCLDLQRLWDFTERNNVGKHDFIIHVLMRQELALKADFCLVQKPLWVYVHSERQTDVAVNRTGNGVSVYDPSYSYRRFHLSVLWARETDGDAYGDVLFVKIYKAYLYAVTWGFYINNSSREMQKHYSYEKIKFSVSGERKKFFAYAFEEYRKIFGQEMPEHVLSEIRSITWKDKYITWFPTMIKKVFLGSGFYEKLGHVYRWFVNLRFRRG